MQTLLAGNTNDMRDNIKEMVEEEEEEQEEEDQIVDAIAG